MARKRRSRLDLPERVYFHHGTYYYVGVDHKWRNLGREYTRAMTKWAELLESPKECSTVGELLDRYLCEIVPTKAERTQRDNRNEIRFLRAFFGEMSIQDVLPQHIAQYRDSRAAKTRGNREIALLSHAFGKACEWGLARTNPCSSVKRNRERARTRYVEDGELTAFRAICPEWLQTYLDLKALTGLRQQDLLILARGQASDTHLVVRPLKTENSTQKVLRIVLTPELRRVVEAAPGKGVYLFTSRNGTPYTDTGFASAWQRVMKKFVAAGNERFHEHDIRGKVATDIDDPLAAQKLLGHQSIKMTEDYIKQRKADEVMPHGRKQ